MRADEPLLPFEDPEVLAREAVLGADREEDPDEEAFVRDEPEDFARDVPDDFVPEDFVPDEDDREDVPDDEAREVERDEPDFDLRDEPEADLRDDEERDDAERELERDEAGLRSLAGTSSLMTSLTSCGICFSMKLCIRSSWRRNSFASFTVSLSPSWSATASITL